MSLWQAIVLVNLALALGVAWGYLRWGTEVRRLRQELAAARAAGVSRPWPGQVGSARGIVRAVEAGAVVLTHEAIPGLMGAMTMALPVEDVRVLAGIGPGDRVRFAVRYTGEGLVLTAIEREPP